MSFDVSGGSHLSVVIDLSPAQWHLSSQSPPANVFPLPLKSFLSQLLAFLNAHIASRHENTLAVFAALPGRSIMLYSSSDPPSDSVSHDANSYPPFKFVDSTIMSKIVSELESLSELEEEAPCAVVGALTKALCYVNRLTLESNVAITNAAEGLEPLALPDPRVLILSVSPDQTTSYIPIMNSIFSAQKLKVTIDACQIYGPDSVFLQQAAHLTGGSYIYLERRDALLQYLTMTFLPSPSVRKTISVPTQDKIDFRAACFCHKNIVDVGFVCSVCLSIFCQPVPVCSTCRTKFPMKTLQRLNSSRPSLPSNKLDSSNASASTPSPRAQNRVPPTPSTGPRSAEVITGSGGLPHSSTIGLNGTGIKNGTLSG